MWAAMDIGTNSCRLLIADPTRGGKLNTAVKLLRTTRIGQGLCPQKNFLRQEAMDRTLEALQEYDSVIRKYPVTEIQLIATQAIREAENGNTLVGVIKERFGWELQIVSGQREAWLSYLGASGGLMRADNPLIIDIGGGSTELIVMECENRLKAVSIPLGALRLHETPLTDEELKRLFTDKIKDFPQDPGISMVGVGGTCTSIAAILLALKVYDAQKVQGFTMSVDDIRNVYRKLINLQPLERLTIAGVYPGREDIITEGIRILLTILGIFRKKDMLVSDQDLLQGLMYEKMADLPS